MSQSMKKLILLVAYAAAVVVPLFAMVTTATKSKELKVLVDEVVAESSPMAAHVIEHYRDCLRSKSHDSGGGDFCKSVVTSMISRDQNENFAKEAETIIDLYESKKLLSLGVPNGPVLPSRNLTVSE